MPSFTGDAFPRRSASSLGFTVNRRHRSKSEVCARIWVVVGVIYSLAVAFNEAPRAIGLEPPHMFFTQANALLWLLLTLAYSASLAWVAVRRSHGWIGFPIALLLCSGLIYWLWAVGSQLQQDTWDGLKLLSLGGGIIGIPSILALRILVRSLQKIKASELSPPSAVPKPASWLDGAVTGRKFFKGFLGVLTAGVLLDVLCVRIRNAPDCENAVAKNAKELAGIDDAHARSKGRCATSPERCRFAMSNNSDGSFSIYLRLVREEIIRGCVVAETGPQMIYGPDGKILRIEEENPYE
jgi:hypothetical protein